MDGEAPQKTMPKESGVGPTVGIVIIVILIALGGAYFFYKENVRIHTPPLEEYLNA